MATSWAALVDAAVDERSRWHSANTGLVTTPDLLGDRFIADLRDVASRDGASPSLVFCARDLRRKMEDYEAEPRPLVKLADTGRVVLALERALKTAFDLLPDDELEVAREWRRQLRSERDERVRVYDALLADADLFNVEIGNDCQEMELQARLKHDLVNWGHDLLPGELRVMSMVFDAVVWHSGVVMVALPVDFATTAVEWPDAAKSAMTGEESCLQQTGLWSTLRHPNVRRLYGRCHVGEEPFVIHEMYEPVDCEGYDWKRVLGCARGLQYVHERGLVHHNFTVENLLFSRGRMEGVLSGLGLVRRNYTDGSLSGEGSESDGTWRGLDGAESVCLPSRSRDVLALGMTILGLLVKHRVSDTGREWQSIPKVKQLPDAKPDFVANGEWNLLLGMCATDPAQRLSMLNVVYQLSVLADGEDSASDTKLSSHVETLVDVREYIIPLLDATIGEVLADAHELCAECDTDLAGVHRPVLERLEDIFHQLLELPTTARLSLVESYTILLERWYCRFNSKLPDSNFSQDSEVSPSSRTIAGRNYGFHYDIDRLLRDFAADGLKNLPLKNLAPIRKPSEDPAEQPVTLPRSEAQATGLSQQPAPMRLGKRLQQKLHEMEAAGATDKAIELCRWDLNRRIASYEGESRPLVQLAHIGQVVVVLKRAWQSATGILNLPNTLQHDTMETDLQDERNENAAFYERLLEDEDRFLREIGDEQQQREVLTLLTYEMDRFRAVLTTRERRVIEALYDAVVRHSSIVVVKLPGWFVTPMDEWMLAERSYMKGGEESCVRQADIWSELHHPNVRKFYGAYHVGKTPFVIHDMSSDLTTLEPSEFVGLWKLLLGFARGLQYLHRQGLVHEKMSTSNLQISWERKGVLSGMGLIHLAPGDTDMFDEDDSVGKRNNSNGDIDGASVASDILAFGHRIFILLRKRPPYIDGGTKVPESMSTEAELLARPDVVHVQIMERRRRREDRIARRANPSQPDENRILPAERPAYVREAEWHLLTRMCFPDATKRLSMTAIIDEMERLANVVQPTSLMSEAGQELVPDIASYTVWELENQTVADALVEAKNLSYAFAEAHGDNQRVYARIEDVYKQLQSKAPVRASLVTDFAIILCRFITPHFDNGSLDGAADSTTSVHHAYADKNSPIHHDLDRLLDDGRDILVKQKRVHCWKRSSARYKTEKINQLQRANLLQDCQDDGKATGPETKHGKADEPRHDTIVEAEKIAAGAKWLLSPDEVNVGRPIGRGAFGAVYAGTWLGSDVVVKQVTMNQDNEIHMKQFLDEANLWFGLNHTSLIRLFGAWVQGRPSFVCERAIYGTLEEYSKAKEGNKRKTREEIWRSLYVAAQGLEHLHGHNIAHGDLKGNNILVCEFETVKLADFGMSVILNTKMMSATSAGSTLGAVHWRAPERLKGAPPSLESDIYSFGICIVEALTGQYPWCPQTDHVVAHKVAKGELIQRPEGFSDAEWNLVERMCCFNPEERISVGAVVNIAYGLYTGSSPRARRLLEEEQSIDHQTEGETELPQTLQDFSRIGLNGSASVHQWQPSWKEARYRERYTPETLVEGPTLILEDMESADGRPEALALLQSVAQSPGLDIAPAIPGLPPWFVPAHRVQLGKHLADGSSGAVYEGVYLDSPVVVKQVLLPGFAAKERLQFVDEANLWFSLRHPNLVELFGACHEGRPCFVCERAMGGTIVNYAKNAGSPSRVWALLHQAALGLQHMHNHNIVHGDLKGNNILVDEQGCAKLADFGLSFATYDKASTTVADGGALGAFRWKAPEVLQGRRATFESDIYSFGMSIIEVVTGNFPWGNSIPDAAVKHYVATRRMLPQRPTDFGDEQWRLVTRMCSYDPEERISVGAVVSILESFISAA